MTLRSLIRGVVGKARAVPAEWTARGGSEPEYFVYVALTRMGLREGADFTYQYVVDGGRSLSGGAVPDFVIHEPVLGINVQGAYWHARTPDQRAHDTIQQAQIEGSGIPMAYITEDQARENDDHYVRLALAGLLRQGPLGF